MIERHNLKYLGYKKIKEKLKQTVFKQKIEEQVEIKLVVDKRKLNIEWKLNKKLSMVSKTTPNN